METNLQCSRNGGHCLLEDLYRHWQKTNALCGESHTWRSHFGAKSFDSMRRSLVEISQNSERICQ